MIALLVTSVFTTATDGQDAEENTEAEEEIIKEKSGESISEDVSSYVGEFVEKRGINPETINNVTEVDFGALPKEVNIENVDDTNLAIYQIDYNKTADINEKIFVITYSVEKLKSQGDIILSQDKREFLNFGFSGEMSKSGFLKSATGVEGSLEKGYVMMRHGSITGISTSLEIMSGSGNLEIIIYKNGEPIQFGNSFVADSAGVKTDYDIQSKNTVSFESGDVISLYIKTSEGVIWKDVTTLMEIVTD